MDIKQAVYTVADFIPVVSNVKAIYEATVGKNPFTGRKLEAWERGASAASILGGPIVKGIKHGGKAVVGIVKNGSKSTKKTTAATKPKDTTTPSQKKQENKPKPNTTPGPAGNKKQTTSTPQNGNKPAAAKQQGKGNDITKGSYSSFRDLMSLEETTRYDKYWYNLGVDKATKARDAKLAEIGTWSNTKKNDITTVVGGVDLNTGKVAVGTKSSKQYSGKPIYAEDLVVEQLGGNHQNIIMTDAIRPRKGSSIPVCKRWQTKLPEK
ncbi:pre-toxin TG domain-containing protein [Lysinibacillus odysseyi]|nr:pre-toxin TG domain-containing protein [Lysinibacillus odysseyi]